MVLVSVKTKRERERDFVTTKNVSHVQTTLGELLLFWVTEFFFQKKTEEKKGKEVKNIHSTTYIFVELSTTYSGSSRYS